MKWRLIPYQIAAPAWNMALDEAIFLRYLDEATPPTLRFYGWNPPSVSIGYFQDVARELDLPSLRKQGFGLVRRNTGGRAVLHDRELTYSVCAGFRDGVPANLIPSYLYISQAFVAALQQLGVPVEMHQGVTVKNPGSAACFDSPSWYELTVGGRKLVGSAQYRYKDAFLQHGSILLAFSAEQLSSVLNAGSVPPEKLNATLHDKVTSLEREGFPITPAELGDNIVAAFAKLYTIQFEVTPPTGDEMELAERIMREKYLSDQWNLTRGKMGQRDDSLVERPGYRGYGTGAGI